MILPPERPGHPAPEPIAAARAASAAAIAQRRWQSLRQPLAEQIGGIEVLRIVPEGGPPRARVLHLHGGGFRMGLPEMDVPFAEALADHCRVELVLVRYRLAPEHPFPAGLSDAFTVLAALPRDLPLIVMGASAGGGLAAGAALLAAQDGPAIDGLVLLSAWLDLTVQSRAYAINAGSDPLFSKESALAANALYLQGHDPRDPLASPLFADPAHFPPTLITAGTGEVLADDARNLAASLGEKAELLLVPDMEHVAVTRMPDAVGAPQVFEAVARFIEARLAD